MSFFDQRYYAVSKANMARAGVWPEQSENTRIIWPLTMIATQLTLGGPMLIRLRDIWGDVDTVITSLTQLLFGCITSAMLMNVMLEVDTMKLMLNDIEKHWQMFRNKPSVVVFAKYAERGRYFAILGSIFAYTTLALYLAVSIHPILLDLIDPLNETRPKDYLFEAEYGVDSDKYYWFIIGHAYMVAVVAVHIIVTFETAYIMFVVHACTLFEVVAFAERIQNFFSGFTVVIIAIVVILISLTGIQILINWKNPLGLIRAVNYTSALLFHLYVNTIPGQQLIDHSYKVQTSAYDLNWYDMSVKTQKLWILILIRSNKPCLLAAGKIYVISMESFSLTIQTALSYFMILAQLL